MVRRKTQMKDKIKQLLAEQIGVEAEDINDDDSFAEDLHMSPSDLSDFVHSLANSGFDIGSVDLADIETVDNLLENLEHEEIK